MASLRAPFIDRFWRHVHKTKTCWVWTSGIRNGYGRIWLPGGLVAISAHRAAWEIHFGPIPQGLLVLHRCDNKVCVNPKHLFLGTSQDNHDDMCRKRRIAHGERHGNSKLSDTDVAQIRRHRRQGVPLRVLARLFSVHLLTISFIATNRTWKHVCTDPIIPSPQNFTLFLPSFETYFSAESK